MNEVSCAVHVHSKFSDGTKEISEIVEIAEKAGVDIVIFTDHRTLGGKEIGNEGWHGKVLVLFGQELNDLENKNHYLAFGIDEAPSREMKAREYVEEVKNKGGFGFIAHPLERRNAHPSFPPYPWTEWSNSLDFDGMEIWNFLSCWMEGVNRRNAIFRVLFPHSGVKAPDSSCLKLWDKLNEKKDISGIGSVDVHGISYPIFLGIPMVVCSYDLVLRSIRTNIYIHKMLTGKPDEDRALVFEALLKGRSYIVNYALGKPNGFHFVAKKKDGNEEKYPGEKIEIEKGVVFELEVPEKCDIKIFRRGERVAWANAKKLVFFAKETGKYRAEVWKGNRGWIFTNMITAIKRT